MRLGDIVQAILDRPADTWTVGDRYLVLAWRALRVEHRDGAHDIAVRGCPYCEAAGDERVWLEFKKHQDEHAERVPGCFYCPEVAN